MGRGLFPALLTRVLFFELGGRCNTGFPVSLTGLCKRYKIKDEYEQHRVEVCANLKVSVWTVILLMFFFLGPGIISCPDLQGIWSGGIYASPWEWRITHPQQVTLSNRIIIAQAK